MRSFDDVDFWNKIFKNTCLDFEMCEKYLSEVLNIKRDDNYIQRKDFDYETRAMIYIVSKIVSDDKIIYIRQSVKLAITTILKDKDEDYELFFLDKISISALRELGNCSLNRLMRLSENMLYYYSVLLSVVEIRNAGGFYASLKKYK